MHEVMEICKRTDLQQMAICQCTGVGLVVVEKSLKVRPINVAAGGWSRRISPGEGERTPTPVVSVSRCWWGWIEVVVAKIEFTYLFYVCLKFIFESNSKIYIFKINFILYQLTYYFSETNKKLRTDIS